VVDKNMIDTNYHQWLAALKEKIRASQMKAVFKVNIELLSLYWELDKELTGKQVQSKWGDKIIAQLAKDLLSEFPEVKGFSASNLKYIRQWHQYYAAIGQQAVGQLENKASKRLKKKSQQAVGQINQPSSFPAVLGNIPWGHHIQIISKTCDITEALFYIRQTALNN
jgi:predicted nuclease of restriction endonuclease-like (RecB) superfamily